MIQTPSRLLTKAATKAVVTRKIFGILQRTALHLAEVPRGATGFEIALHMQRWAKVLLDVCDVHVDYIGGTPPEWGCLQVSNHRSYMDIMLLGSISPGMYIAKAEIKDWPIIGPAATRGDSIYVDRDNKDSRKAVREALGRGLQRGYTMNVFPEGTTAAAPGTIGFRSGSFEVAAELGAKIAPVALEYELLSDGWINNEPPLQHFTRVHGGPKRARISFGPIMQGSDGKELARQAQAWINAELDRIGDFSKPVQD